MQYNMRVGKDVQGGLVRLARQGSWPTEDRTGVLPEEVGDLVAQVDEGSKLHEFCQAVDNVQKLNDLQKVHCG